jgi:two-component system sensor histidine kinase KdpD
MTVGHTARGLAAPYALPAGFAALLGVGTVAAALGGRLPGTGVLIACAVAAGLMSFVAEPLSAPALALIGWLTAAGFARPPYGNLRLTGPFAWHAAIAVAASAIGGAALGALYRWSARRFTLVGMGAPSEPGQGGWPTAATGRGGAPAQPGPFPERYLEPGRQPGLAGAIDSRRRLFGAALAVALIPLLTLALVAARRYLDLDDDLLIYLVVVVTTAVVGGFWPAVLTAVASSLLINWFFTPPLHTLSIGEPRNLLALVLFVTVAVAVSSVVHLAARRAQQAAHSRAEAASLLTLAQTVLGGADTPSAVLEHLTSTLGGRAELREQVSGRWVPVAASGVLDEMDGALLSGPERHPTARIDIRPDLRLLVAEQARSASPGLLVGFAAQAAAALDRERLRTQAAQAEALAEGNRMRTALLAAVSHDLRTPLASIKASASTLRQTDVEWTPADQAALLATIDENADRLDALIGNLLDMSRLHTGSLEPFLRPTAIDEVAPVALRGLDGPSGRERGAQLRMEVPDRLPLVRADPGLLERVLANLFSNALRHSPTSRPPALRARQLDQRVLLEVVDHGPGVPDELKDAIFEPFLRLDRQHGGVGLGLAVAKGFAEAMGGTIGAADTADGGLTIKVTLPIVSSDTRSALGAEQ